MTNYDEDNIKDIENINKNVVSAINNTFFVSNYVDLRAHTYTVLHAMDYTRKMMENCDTIEKGFDTFINTLVKPEFQEKMREFCDSNTIAKRVKGNRQIDCEYLSKVAIGWCRASLYPTEWDEDGDVTHVLFTVSSIDDNLALEIEEGLSNKKDLQAVFDTVPGGIVTYEWDGKELKTLKMSKYYKELYGYSMYNKEGGPDFERIHPDDVDDYKKAIVKALTETYYLEYVFRVWDQNKNRYGWTQINAVAKPHSDGKSIVYAIYTDVTEQKIAQQRLKKSNASIMAALGSAEQFSYEYDPVMHTSTCFTNENNGYDLGNIIYDYPECFRNSDFMHPDDVELFIETVHKIDKGEDSSHCNIRVFKDGKMHWHSCTFDSFYDSEKERRVALLTVVDITPQKMAMESYEKRLEMFARTNKDALCMCDINITRNQFSNVQAAGIIKECSEKAHTLDEFMVNASKAVFDENERERYLKLFNQKTLLELFDKGNNHIKLEHFYRINATHTEWVETVFDLITDPATGDIVGVSYAKSLNDNKLSRILLDAALEKDYPMAALVYVDTGEYFLFETEKGEYCEHKLNYWDSVYERLADAADGQTLTEIRNNLTEEKVKSFLNKRAEYAYTFYGFYHGMRCRLEAKFRYADKEHGLIIATLRNITDTSLYLQYKHDSEHDGITGLLNRISFFKKCRRILIEHPVEEFAMLRCDVRHFHLYNTFFGEKEGDKLLCKIAALIEKIGSDYEYGACGRIDADVFGIFFPLNREVLEKHINHFIDEIAKLNDDFPIEANIGIYRIDDASMPIEAMFTRATIAAKTCKKNVFGKISRFDDLMEQELKDIQQITSEMHAAIAKKQFEVYLQPKYSLRSEKLVGSEALVRWKHPERGLVSPEKFIPVFENNGFIAELDKYMWEQVCQILKRWKDEGKSIYPISVNMSRVSMYNRATVPFIISLIEKYELEPKYLELELTESAYMDDPEDLKNMLKELQEYGFKILMDDFGSGYSSLNTLKELPVDVLKLDMKFLSESQNDKRGTAVLSSVVRMSKLLEIPIVAEGVEKREQANYLRDIGCEYAQGYLFAKPMPVVEYEDLLIAGDICEESKPEIEENSVISMFIEHESLASSISEAFPTPLALIEYENGRMGVLRANSKFLKQFDMIENSNPASQFIREKLDEENNRILSEALEECAKEKKQVTFSITWPGTDENEQLVGSVDYEGMIDHITNMLLVFVNVSKVNR